MCVCAPGSCGSALEKAGVSQSQDGPGGGHEGGRGASECQPAQTVSINTDKSCSSLSLIECLVCVCAPACVCVCVWVYGCIFIALSQYVCVCVFQHHIYILQAEVLYNSWPLDDSLSGFIQTLRDRENNEMRGEHSSQSHVPQAHICFNQSTACNKSCMLTSLQRCSDPLLCFNTWTHERKQGTGAHN